MKLTTVKSVVLALVISTPMSVMAEEQSNSDKQYTHPIEAIAQIPVTGVKIAGGIAAIPLMFVGEIGNVSGQVGEELWEHSAFSENSSK